MATNAFDRLKSAASGAVVISTAVAARALRTAAPLVDKAMGAIRSRPADSSPPPRGTGPVVVTPEPAEATPAAPTPPAKPSVAAPTPAAVAKNIPPHPPTPAGTTKKPVKKAVPGAKLPPRRTADGS